jgi:uncharacterized protein
MPEVSPDTLARLTPWFLGYGTLVILGLSLFWTRSFWLENGPALPMPPGRFHEILLAISVGIIFFLTLGRLEFLPLVFIGYGLFWQYAAGSWRILFRYLPWRLVLMVFALIFAVHGPLQLLATALQKSAETIGWTLPPQPAIALFLNTEDPTKLALLVIQAVILAPVGEELFFRGLLYPLACRRYPRLLANVMVSLLFALLHGHLVSFLPLFIFGFILSRLLDKTGNLWAPLLLHAGFNSLTVVFLLLTK